MSQGTPAKQNRIEKHLSRQRGAGARNLDAEFGFTFELGNGSSTLPIPIRASQAKRRKTGEHATIEAVGVQTSVVQKHSALELELQAVQEATSRQNSDNVEEKSAIATTRITKKATEDEADLGTAEPATKKGRSKRTRKAQQVEPAQAVEDVAQPPVARPRRRAAAAAIDKVMAGFREESIPIEKKRRDPELHEETRRRRKRTVDTASNEGPKLSEEALLVAPSGASERQDAPTTCDATAAGSNGSQEAGRHTNRAETATSPLRSVRKSESREMRGRRAVPKRNEPSDSEQMVDHGRERARLPLAEVQGNANSVSPEKSTKTEKETSKPASALAATRTRTKALGPLHTVADAFAKPAGRTRTRKGGQVFKDPDTAPEESVRRATVANATGAGQRYPRSKRELVETNAVGLSKRSAEDPDASHASPGRKGRAHATEAKESPSSQDSFEKNAEVSGAMSKQATTKPRTQRKSDRHDAADGSKQSQPRKDHTCSPAVLDEALNASFHLEKKSKQQSRTTRKQKVNTERDVEHGNREDMDWLFDKSQPKPTRKPRATQVKARKRLSRTDMDLDDLLSNIASFAPRSR